MNGSINTVRLPPPAAIQIGGLKQNRTSWHALQGSETQGDILLKRERCAYTAPLFFICYGMADQ
nr:MAG TPA: hypothetical protein [Caudoviricetes sp.]